MASEDVRKTANWHSLSDTYKVKIATLRYLHRQILPILGDTLTSHVRVLSTC